MIIKELNVIEFGGLCNRHFELTSGINIFEGDNEAGKSTLWLFIKFMLYGMPKKGHPERDRAINRMSHRALGTMTVSFGGEDYRIERSFSENSRGKVTTLRLSDGEKMFVDTEPGEAMLGVPRDVFENSVAIGQGSCAGLGGDKGVSAIRNILSSADESVDVDKIQKKLGSIRVFYRHVNGKGGKLFELSQKKNALEDRLSIAVSSRLKINETEEKLLRNEKNIEAAERELEAARCLVDNLGRREIIQRFDVLYENEDTLRALIDGREALLDREKRDGYIPLAVDGAALRAASDGYENAEQKMAEAELIFQRVKAGGLSDGELSLAEIGERIEIEGGIEKLLTALKKSKIGKGVGSFLVAVGLAAVAATVWNSLLFIGLSVGVVLSALGMILAVASAKAARVGTLGNIPKGQDAEAYLERCNRAYETVQRQRQNESDAEADLRECRRLVDYFAKELSRAMSRVGARSAVTVENARAESCRIERFLSEYNEVSAKIENLKATLSRDRELLAAYNEEELRLSMTGVEIPDMSVKVAEERQRYYKESLAKLRDRGSDLKTELINLKARGEDPEALGDELEAVKLEYEAAERVYEALLVAIDGVDAAAESLRGNLTPTIGRNATELISGLTDGRYGEVSVGKDLDIILFDDAHLSTSSAMMSGGMRDAAYLALRLSLMRNLFDGEMPPVMMDETLCQLDNTRTERALKMISRISSEGTQVLLFTCHTREGEICERLLIPANIVYMNEKKA